MLLKDVSEGESSGDLAVSQEGIGDDVVASLGERGLDEVLDENVALQGEIVELRERVSKGDRENTMLRSLRPLYEDQAAQLARYGESLGANESAFEALGEFFSGNIELLARVAEMESISLRGHENDPRGLAKLANLMLSFQEGRGKGAKTRPARLRYIRVDDRFIYAYTHEERVPGGKGTGTRTINYEIVGFHVRVLERKGKAFVDVGDTEEARSAVEILYKRVLTDIQGVAAAKHIEGLIRGKETGGDTMKHSDAKARAIFRQISEDNKGYVFDYFLSREAGGLLADAENTGLFRERVKALLGRAKGGKLKPAQRKVASSLKGKDKKPERVDALKALVNEVNERRKGFLEGSGGVEEVGYSRALDALARSRRRYYLAVALIENLSAGQEVLAAKRK